MVDVSLAVAGTIKLGIAGFFGVIVRMIKTPHSDWKQWVYEVISGMACCIYLTPMASDLFNTSDDVSYGIGFLIGYTGITLANVLKDQLIKVIKGHK